MIEMHLTTELSCIDAGIGYAWLLVQLVCESKLREG